MKTARSSGITPKGTGRSPCCSTPIAATTAPVIELVAGLKANLARDLEHRGWADNPNKILARPTFYELAGDLAGLDIINLSCGYGDFGQEALAAGPRRYIGAEALAKIVEGTRQTLTGTTATIEQARLREGRPQPEQFSDSGEFENRKRIPLFLIVASRKP